jgi:hypothetical protein
MHEAVQPTHSALVVVVPEAEPAVGDSRRELDVAASWGVPAHVTVLYPFAPPDELGDRLFTRIARAVSTCAPFDATFASTDWFGEDVVWLAPEPRQAFADLIAAVTAEFPEFPPYGGAFDEVVPHLTIGHGGADILQRLQAAERDVRRSLPVQARISHVSLLAGAMRPDTWRTVRTFPLGG